MSNHDEVTPPAADEIFGEALKLCSRLWESSLLPTGGPGSSAPSEKPSGLESVQPAWRALFSLQETCTEMADHLSEAVPGSAVMDLYRGITEAMTAGFKEEFLKLLNIPAVGITRFYQERMNRALETYSSFQSALSEFFKLLAVPLEKAADALREEMGKAEKDGLGRVPDHQTFYRLWIKTLESYYSTLLRSEQYTETLAKTLSALYDHREAKKKFLLDLLRDWPVATTEDVDEISRELYLLKKRVKGLEKKGMQ